MGSKEQARGFGCQPWRLPPRHVACPAYRSSRNREPPTVLDRRKSTHWVAVKVSIVRWVTGFSPSLGTMLVTGHVRIFFALEGLVFK